MVCFKKINYILQINLSLFIAIIYAIIYLLVIILLFSRNSFVQISLGIFSLILVTLIIIFRIKFLEFENKTQIVQKEKVYQRGILLFLLILFLLSLKVKIIFNLLIFITVPFLWLCIKNKPLSELGIKKRHAKESIVIGVLTGTLSLPLLYYLFRINLKILPGALVRPRTFGEYLLSFPPGIQKLLFVIYAFFIISFGEEILFRGFLQNRLIVLFKKTIGILVSALIYVLPHLVFLIYWDIKIIAIFIPAIYILGLIFGLIFLETENLISVWLAHGIIVSLLGIIIGPF